LASNNRTPIDDHTARLHVITRWHGPWENLGIRIRLLRQNVQMETRGLLCGFKGSVIILTMVAGCIFTPSVLGIAIGLLNRAISMLGLPKNDTVRLVIVFALVTAHYL